MNAPVQANLITAQINQLSEMLGLHNVDPAELEQTLMQTAFKSDAQITREQMGALLIVAGQYKLNPWTKEIYAFPDKKFLSCLSGSELRCARVKRWRQFLSCLSGSEPV